MRMVIYVLAVVMSVLFMGCDDGNPSSCHMDTRHTMALALLWRD